MPVDNFRGGHRKVKKVSRVLGGPKRQLTPRRGQSEARRDIVGVMDEKTGERGKLGSPPHLLLYCLNA